MKGTILHGTVYQKALLDKKAFSKSRFKLICVTGHTPLKNEKLFYKQLLCCYAVKFNYTSISLTYHSVNYNF